MTTELGRTTKPATQSAKCADRANYRGTWVCVFSRWLYQATHNKQQQRRLVLSSNDEQYVSRLNLAALTQHGTTKLSISMQTAKTKGIEKIYDNLYTLSPVFTLVWRSVLFCTYCNKAHTFVFITYNHITVKLNCTCYITAFWYNKLHVSAQNRHTSPCVKIQDGAKCVIFKCVALVRDNTSTWSSHSCSLYSDCLRCRYYFLSK
jgi:hypothetical protein